MFPDTPDISLKAGKTISIKAMPNIPDENMMYRYSTINRINIPPMEDPHTLRNSISRLRICIRVINKER